jgi:hypothetical protein
MAGPGTNAPAACAADIRKYDSFVNAPAPLRSAGRILQVGSSEPRSRMPAESHWPAGAALELGPVLTPMPAPIAENGEKCARTQVGAHHEQRAVRAAIVAGHVIRGSAATWLRTSASWCTMSSRTIARPLNRPAR